MILFSFYGSHFHSLFLHFKLKMGNFRSYTVGILYPKSVSPLQAFSLLFTIVIVNYLLLLFLHAQWIFQYVLAKSLYLLVYNFWLLYCLERRRRCLLPLWLPLSLIKQQSFCLSVSTLTINCYVELMANLLLYCVWSLTGWGLSQVTLK